MRFTYFMKDKIFIYFNHIQDGPFWDYSRMEGAAKELPFLTSVTHILQWWNLVQLYLNLKMIQKIYKSRDTSYEFCWHQHFSPEISNFWYIRKCRYTLHFNTKFLILFNIFSNLFNFSNYIVDVVMWPKFGNSSISMREVMITTIL